MVVCRFMVKRRAGKARKHRNPAMTRRQPTGPTDEGKSDQMDERDGDVGENAADPQDESRDDVGDGTEAEQPPRWEDEEPQADATAAADGAETDEPSPADEASPPQSEEPDVGKVAAAPAAAAPPPPPGAAWARPLVRLEKGWTWLESRLLLVVLAALILLLVLWVSMSGMSEPVQSRTKAGFMFRALVGMIVLGVPVRLLVKRFVESRRWRSVISLAALFVAILLAPLWRGVGVEYVAGWKRWLDVGSSIGLFGGLREIGTRLTILVALLGGSLAAATGTHINIDVVVRFLPQGYRRLIHILACLMTALVCVVSAWGFFDYIAIEGYRARPDWTANERISHVGREMGRQFFMWRKQVALDFGAVPHVITGKDWDADDRMTGREWNAWLDDAGFTEHYAAEELVSVRAPESALDQPRVPYVVLPGGESAKGYLVPLLNLIFPFGFVMIALRFLLRALLVVTGHVGADPEGAELEPTPDEKKRFDKGESEEAA